jgi:hypothetical protein
MRSSPYTRHTARATVIVDPRAQDPFHYISLAPIQSIHTSNVADLSEPLPMCARSSRNEIYVEPVDGPVKLPNGDMWTSAMFPIQDSIYKSVASLLTHPGKTERRQVSTETKSSHGHFEDDGHSLRFVSGWPFRQRVDPVFGYDDHDERWQDDMSIPVAAFFVPVSHTAEALSSLEHKDTKGEGEGLEDDWEEAISIPGSLDNNRDNNNDSKVDYNAYAVYAHCVKPDIRITREASELIRRDRQARDSQPESDIEGPVFEITIDYSDWEDYSHLPSQTIKVVQRADVIHIGNTDCAGSFFNVYAKPVRGTRSLAKPYSSMSGPVYTEDVDFIYHRYACHLEDA